MRHEKDQKYISFNEAGKISGYNLDYIGWLIRKRRIKGISEEENKREEELLENFSELEKALKKN